MGTNGPVCAAFVRSPTAIIALQRDLLRRSSRKPFAEPPVLKREIFCRGRTMRPCKAISTQPNLFNLNIDHFCWEIRNGISEFQGKKVVDLLLRGAVRLLHITPLGYGIVDPRVLCPTANLFNGW